MKTTPKIFISYSHKDSELINEIRHILMENGFQVLSDHQIRVGEDLSNSILEQIKQADYFILFMSDSYLESKTATNERNLILGYSHSSSKSVLPILITHAEIPTDISKLLYLNAINESPAEVAQNVIRVIGNLEAQKVGEKEQIAERAQKISISISAHIEPIIADLNAREKSFRKTASNWNFLGYVSIIIGIFAAIILVVIDIETDSKIDLNNIIYLGIKGTILLVLLLTSSKYAFTLSKSYMNEALKVADRIHAISFGKFYIKAFENTVNPSDFKEIFQNWNVNQDSSFSNISAENYDPKIAESVTKIFDSIKDIAKK